MYRGFAEPEGVAVVCLYCKGKGYLELEDNDPRITSGVHTLFTSRKPKNGIKYVRQSRGSFVLSCGPTGRTITYESFSQGEMP